MLNLWVTVYLVAEVIQGIQKWLRVGAHAAGAGRCQRYAGTLKQGTQLYKDSIRR